MTDDDAPPVDRELLGLAVGVARRAGQLAAERFFAGQTSARRKPDGTEVTEADLAVEELCRAELGRRVPDDGIYGEEGGDTPGTSGRRWIIDPIDGTYLFARGIPTFEMIIAYEDEHGSAIGVINQPVARQVVYAGRGLGCWRATGDGAPAVRTRVSDRSRFLGARTATVNLGTWPEELLLALHRKVFLFPVGGTVGLVTSQIDAFVYTGEPAGYEDVAALPVLITEAGGRVTSLGGDDVLAGGDDVLATNGLLHDDFLPWSRACRGPGTGERWPTRRTNPAS